METEHKSSKMETVSYVLRVIILASGIYQTFWGETSIGLLTLIAFVVITFPAFFTRNFLKKFPVEIEVMLCLMVLLQFILGEARDFYTEIPYYDKFVHYLLPMLLGIIGFVIFYTLHQTQRMDVSTGPMMLIIILITLGVGALWEIVEYLSDVILLPRIPGWHQFQGSGPQDAITDTMTDLMYDTVGGIFGAFLGLWLINRPSYNKRASELVEEVSDIFYKK